MWRLFNKKEDVIPNGLVYEMVSDVFSDVFFHDKVLEFVDGKFFYIVCEYELVVRESPCDASYNFLLAQFAKDGRFMLFDCVFALDSLALEPAYVV